jgi:hypothetical protein
MKKTTALACLALLTTLSLRADVLFQDALNYPDGLIETDGVWYCYAPATPALDAFVADDLLILDSSHSDAVAAPFTNNTGSTLLYASFTINASKLPAGNGGYFVNFGDATNNAVSKIFIDARNTVVPGTYRLGIANFATSITTAGATNFPMDLATGITYQVVFAYDPDNSSPLAGGTLWVNPSVADLGSPSGAGANYVYPTDTSTSATLLDINISHVGFSQYANQGVVAVGNVNVGTTPGDVDAAIPRLPVIGVQPQGTNVYSGNAVTLYSAASGIDVTYQWLLNNVPLSDDGVTVSGSTSNVLTLSNLAATGNYSVAVSDAAGSVTSYVAAVSVNTTPTPPVFTVQPQSQTNSLGSTVIFTANAVGTGPITYQWNFAPTNSSSYSQVGSGPTLTLANVNFGSSGSYYATAAGGAGGPQNSAAASLLIIPPPTVPIAYLHSLVTTNAPGSYNINGTSVYNVQGIVTTFGPFTASTKTYTEYYIQDNTGGIYVYVGGAGTNAAPAAGSLVSVTGPVTVFDSQLEIDPNISGGTASSNSVLVLSTNNPLPAPQLLNFSLEATNPLGAYGIQIQDALVTVTNVYFYGTKAGGAIAAGTKFYSNGYSQLYMTMGPYDSVTNANTITVFVPAYGGVATNLWGKVEPNYAYQLTGIMSYYNGAEFDPTRYEDFVTTQPATFAAGLTVSNGVSQLTWPAIDGSTYSVYSATNLLGPWTQTFGLGYYPSIGVYAATNAATGQFYKVSTP